MTPARNNPEETKERETKIVIDLTLSFSLADLFGPSTPPPLGYASFLRHLETHQSTSSNFNRTIQGIK
jgi:hypothetical protein